MIETLNAFSTAWWGWMSAMFWQVALLAGLIWLLDRLLRGKMWPQARYALWLLVFIKLIIPPDFSLATGIFSWVEPTAVSVRDTLFTAQSVAAPVEVVNNQAAVKSAPELASATVQPADAPLSWTVLPFAVWILGVCLLLVMLRLNKRRLRRWHDSALRNETLPSWFHDILLETAALFGMERLPGVVFSDHVPAPAVYGFFRQVLILPRRFADELSHEELRFMVVHEMAHLKRRDLLVNGLTTALQIIYWFNPVIVWAQRQVRHARELSCDATAAMALREERQGYRTTLVQAARRLLTESVSPVMGFLGVFEEPHRIISRIKWLERDMSFNKYLISVLSVFILTAGILFAFPMAPVRMTPPAAESGFGILSEDDTRSGNPLAEDRYCYARQETIRQFNVLGIPVDSKLVSAEETWWNEERALLKEEGRRLIVDLKAGTYLFINDVTETWIQVPLPLKTEDLLTDDLRELNESRKLLGTVEDTGARETLMDLPCSVYDYTLWEVRGGQRQNQRTMKIWLTDRLPIPTTALETALNNRRSLYGPLPETLKQLRKLRGFQMKIDFNPGNDIFGARTISETRILELRQLPAELFSIPKGYKNSDKFTRVDL